MIPKMKRGESIEFDLIFWIISTTAGLVLAACVAVGILSFLEIRDFQDDTLEEVGKLVNTGQARQAAQFDDNIDDETILIYRLSDPAYAKVMPLEKPLKVGLQTQSIEGDRWRILLMRAEFDNERYAIAQQTESRDEIAIASSLSVLYPMLLLIVIMLLLIHFIIRRRLKPLTTLADSLDEQDATKIQTIPVTGLPKEMLPFVLSINALIERIQQAMQKQYRFIADAAHELRTPVAGLSLMVENAAKVDSDSVRQERLKPLQIGTERLSRLVDQLLNLARLQSDHSSPLQPVSLNTVLKEVVADLYPLAEAKNIDLGVVSQVELTVCDQQGSLTQLVRNAIDNAIRYSPIGGQVDIRLSAQGNNAQLSVSDSGAGIPADDLSNVLEPFYRAKNAEAGGNGLGLAISAEIAQRLGGKITLSNIENGGLEFSYQQPLC